MARHVQIPELVDPITYVVGATPQSAFAITFPFWAAEDIIVSVDDVVVAQSEYSVEGAFLQDGDTVEGGYGSGTLTLNAAVSSTTVTIDRLVQPLRETDLSATGPVPTRVLNSDLDRLTARDQDILRIARRGGGGGGGGNLGAAADRVLSNLTDNEQARTNLGARARADYPIIQDTLATAGNGTTNCGPTLASTSVDFITLPPGNYRVTTNTTVQRPLFFAPGAIMTIDSGVTVTFAGRGAVGADQRRQIFYGAGAVAGLPFVDVMWFAGDKRYFLTTDIQTEGTIPSGELGADATADLQKAANALRHGGGLRLQEGCFSLAGTSYVDFPVRSHIRGSKRSSFFIFTGTITRGFQLSYQRSTAEGFWFRRANNDVPATAGNVLNVLAGQCTYRDFIVDGGWRAVRSVGASGGWYQTFEIRNAREAGMSFVDTNDAVVTDGFIVSIDEFCTFTSAAGGWNPQPGDTLTGSTSGATMGVRRIGSTGLVISERKYGNAAVPLVGETYTSSSGGTATLSAYVRQHEFGGIRLEQTSAAGVTAPYMEAFMCNSCDIIGGRTSLAIVGNTAGLRGGPSFNRFSDVFFDSALEHGIYMDKCDDIRFTGCSIKSRYDGVWLMDARNIGFINSEVRYCSNIGVHIKGTGNGSLDFIGCTVADNRFGVASYAGAGMEVESGFVGHLKIIGGKFGASALNGIGTQFGIRFQGAASGVTILGVDFTGQGSIGITGFGNLGNYLIDGNKGFRTKSKGTQLISSGNSATALFNHNLSVTPSATNVRVAQDNTNGWGGAAYAGLANVTSTQLALRLYDNNANAFNATRNVVLQWEIDMSYAP